jgi:hypothetical protein
MTIAEKCIGCHTNKTQFGVSYNTCKKYIGTSRHELYMIFRDQYCPCTQCLVKATCTGPKLNMIGYAIVTSTQTFNNHKCNIYKDKVLQFREAYTYNRKGIFATYKRG